MRMILKRILHKWGAKPCIGSIWFRVRTNRRLLWMRYWTCGFHKMRGISWVAEKLPASQEGRMLSPCRRRPLLHSREPIRCWLTRQRKLLSNETVFYPSGRDRRLDNLITSLQDILSLLYGRIGYRPPGAPLSGVSNTIQSSGLLNKGHKDTLRLYTGWTKTVTVLGLVRCSMRVITRDTRNRRYEIQNKLSVIDFRALILNLLLKPTKCTIVIHSLLVCFIPSTCFG
jgi:hypothetical protein